MRQCPNRHLTIALLQPHSPSSVLTSASVTHNRYTTAMNTLPRRAARPIARHFSRTQRRPASDHAHSNHADPAPTSEGFGASFYLAVALIPTSMLVYSFSRPGANGEKNTITRWIERWEEDREDVRRRNAVHTKLVEQVRQVQNERAGRITRRTRVNIGTGRTRSKPIHQHTTAQLARSAHARNAERWVPARGARGT